MKLKPSPTQENNTLNRLGDVPEHWQAKRLKYAFLLQRGFDLPVEDFVEGPYPVCGSNGIIGYHNQYAALGPSVTIGRSGSVGEVNYFENNCWPHNTALYVKQYFQSYPKFVYYLLKIIDLKSLSEGTAVGTLNRNHIHNLMIVVPPSKEQKTIADYLDEKSENIDSLISKKQRQIQLLQEKRSTLISHVVTKGLDLNAKMKDSGVEWLGEVPKHWEVQKLKYNSYIKGRVGWQNLRSEEFTDFGPFLVTGMHFKDGDVDWSACFHITEDRYVMAPEIYVKVGDILITKDGSIGKLAFISSIPGKASLNSHLLIIRPNKETYYPRFMYHLLASNVFQHFILREQSGTTFYGLSQESIENFPALFPPFDEQKRIAYFLDKETISIDKTIQIIHTSILKLQEYRSALISAAVTGKIDMRQEA
jgi:type I restriction enzyme S subunit